MGEAHWLWYPGDYEVWLRAEVEFRRTDRGAIKPPFWPLDAPYCNVLFVKTARCEREEQVEIRVDGDYSMQVDDLPLRPAGPLTLSAGEHRLRIEAVNHKAVPSLYIGEGAFATDGGWQVSCRDGEWLTPGTWTLIGGDTLPSAFHLPTQRQEPVAVETVPGGALVDFGRETFGLLHVTLDGEPGPVAVYYGESRAEALAGERCEVFDRTCKTGAGREELVFPSRALRYAYVTARAAVGPCHLQYEYLPMEPRGTFRCAEERLNRLWEVGLYTLRLNTREFLLDGIKRDRWVWGGDVLQAARMHWYSFADKEVIARSLRALRGKDPVRVHINTIMDYTFYWFLTLQEYYQYTGDRDFVADCYERARSLLDFALSRRDDAGRMTAMPNDWVFIDWAEMEKDGALAAEQILLVAALRVMADFARLLGHTEEAKTYAALCDETRAGLLADYWDEERGAFVTTIRNGVPSREITRHASVLAVLCGLLDEEKAAAVKEKVLLNDAVPAITTPYFRLFELAALCELGEQERVLQDMRAYWGGMLDEGATTFWEEYNPAETGAARYAMYGRPFGKSLCHAWGAGPLYLLGRYYLGVEPTAPGFATYRVRPALGDLEWLEGTVPAADGVIRVRVTRTEICIYADRGEGTLCFSSACPPQPDGGELHSLGGGAYELAIPPGRTVSVTYLWKEKQEAIS